MLSQWNSNVASLRLAALGACRLGPCRSTLQCKATLRAQSAMKRIGNESMPDSCSVDFGRELLNSDLNIAVGYWVDLTSCFLSKEKSKIYRKIPRKPKIPRKIRLEICSEKNPIGFLQSLPLRNQQDAIM